MSINHHTGPKVKIRFFSHFWDDFGLILYDSHKHRLCYLIDDNVSNLQKIPQGEELYERMREIYFNYPHQFWNFIFYPDIGHYDFF